METLYNLSWYLIGAAIVIMAVAYFVKDRIKKKRRYWSSDRSKRNELALKILDALWITFSACGIVGFIIILLC